MIQAFARKLMDHIANDTKVPRNALDRSYTQWQQSREDQIQLEADMDEYYSTNIAAPLRAKESAYDDYLTEKMQLWGAYLAATHGQKRQALLAYVSHPIPEVVQEVVDQALIYTKNVCLQ